MAAPNYYRYLLALWALKTAGIIAGAFLFAISPLPRVVELVLFALAILTQLFALILVRLDFDKRWYVVTDRSLRIREGVFHVQEMTVTFANIQNIAISQGPVQRLLGISDLRVDTAGGGGANTQERGSQWQQQNLHTAWFRGIDKAEEIRNLIQGRLRHQKDAGLGDHDDTTPGLLPSSPSILSALREIHREACALNEAVSNSEAAN